MASRKGRKSKIRRKRKSKKHLNNEQARLRRDTHNEVFRREKQILKNIDKLKKLNKRLSDNSKNINDYTYWAGRELVKKMKQDFKYIEHNFHNLSSNRRYYYTVNLSRFKNVYVNFKYITYDFWLKNVKE